DQRNVVHADRHDGRQRQEFYVSHIEEEHHLLFPGACDQCGGRFRLFEHGVGDDEAVTTAPCHAFADIVSTGPNQRGKSTPINCAWLSPALLSSVTTLRPFAGVNPHSAESTRMTTLLSVAPGATEAKPPVLSELFQGLKRAVPSTTSCAPLSTSR